MGASNSKTAAERQSSPSSGISMYGPLLQSRFLASTTRTTRCDASTVPPPPPLPSTTDASSPKTGESTAAPPPPLQDDSIAQAAQAVSAYANPGPYEMASMDAKRLVTLDTFDGFRCDINKQASPYMAVVHSFWLGTGLIPDGRKSTYTFLTQVADETGRLLMARVDPGKGSVDGRIHRTLWGGLALAKLQMSVTADGQGDQMLGEVDFGGQTWTANVKYGSMGGGLVYGCNYFQAITPSLAMGGEGMYVAANQSLLSNYTLRYTMPAKTGQEDAPLPVPLATPKTPVPLGAPVPDTTGSSTIIVNYNSAGQALTLNYKRVVTPSRVTLGAELACNPFTLESQLLIGAEFKLLRSRVALNVDVNTGRIQSLLEAKLGMGHGSPTLNFSADVDHLREDMKFGYGINVDS